MAGFDQVGSSMFGANAEPETFDVSLQTYLSANLTSTVYPGHIPQRAVLPAYSYFCLSEDPYYTIAAAAGLTNVVYQLDVWAADYLDASVMETALRNILHGFRGMMGSTKVYTSRLTNRSGQYEAIVDGSDEGTYHIDTEYRFIYREPIPTFGS